MTRAPVSIEAVAKHYLGDPMQNYNNEWRYGNKGSLSIDLEKDAWFDHEAQEGGGVVDLIKRSEGPGANIAQILSEKFGVPPDHQKPTRTYGPPRIHDYDGFYQKIKTDDGRWSTQHRDQNGDLSLGLGDAKHRLYRQTELERLPKGQDVYFVEGEKDADSLIRLGLNAVTSGGVSSWRNEFGPFFSGMNVKIIGDNDAAGRGFVCKVAAALRDYASSIQIYELPGLPEKGDLTDWLETHSKEEFLGLQPTLGLPQGKFKLFTLQALAALPEPQFLIDRVILEGTDVILHGESGAHKSGTAISLAVSVAAGAAWIGHKAKQGKVLFIAGEGGTLLNRRIRAALKSYELEDQGNIHVISDNAELYPGEKDTEELEAIAKYQNYSLIIWDTISQHSGSATENSDEMKTVLRNMRKVARACNATNLIVAHPGKDASRGIRGWSGQLNNVDTVIKQSRDEYSIELSCEKQKDAAPFDQIGLSYEIVDDAPVIIEGQKPNSVTSDRRLSKNSKLAYRALCEVLARNDSIIGRPHCTEEEWRKECSRRGLGGTENRDSQKKAFKRAYNDLQESHFYVLDQRVYLVQKKEG